MFRRNTKRRQNKRKTQRKRKSGGGLIKTIKAKLQKRTEKKAQKKTDEIAAVKRYQEAEREAMRDSIAREESRNYHRNLPSQRDIDADAERVRDDYLMYGIRSPYSGMDSDYFYNN